MVYIYRAALGGSESVGACFLRGLESGRGRGIASGLENMGDKSHGRMGKSGEAFKLTS